MSCLDSLVVCANTGGVAKIGVFSIIPGGIVLDVDTVRRRNGFVDLREVAAFEVEVEVGLKCCWKVIINK